MPRLLVGQLGLADQLLLGPLALCDVLDHRHDEDRTAVGVALERGGVLGPQHLAVAVAVAQLRLVGLGAAAHQLVEQRDAALHVVGMGVVAEARDGELGAGAPEHLRDGRIRLRRAPVGAQHHDPDRRALEERAEAADRLELARLAHRGREHHGEHLHRLAVGLGQRRALRADHHVERADHARPVEQRHADQRFVADHPLELAVHARIGLAVLDQQRLALGDRILDDRRGQRADRAEHADGGPRRRGGQEHVVALEHAHHRAVGARQLLAALGDHAHDRVEVAADGGKLPLRLDDAREPLSCAGLAHLALDGQRSRRLIRTYGIPTI
jgi:hypothetical protein